MHGIPNNMKLKKAIPGEFLTDLYTAGEIWSPSMPKDLFTTNSINLNAIKQGACLRDWYIAAGRPGTVYGIRYTTGEYDRDNRRWVPGSYSIYLGVRDNPPKPCDVYFYGVDDSTGYLSVELNSIPDHIAQDALYKLPLMKSKSCEQLRESFSEIILSYDLDNDGVINEDEMVQAVGDYYDNKITGDEMRAVVSACQNTCDLFQWASKPDVLLGNEVGSILNRDFNCNPHLYRCDNEYWDVPMPLLKKFLIDDTTDSKKYVSEFMDCDDFSFQLMGQAHKYHRFLAGGAFFILFVHKKSDWYWRHAVNAVISGGNAYVIEPQTDGVFNFPGTWLADFTLG